MHTLPKTRPAQGVVPLTKPNQTNCVPLSRPCTRHGCSKFRSHTPPGHVPRARYPSRHARLSCFPTRPLSGLVVRTPKGLPYFPVPQSMSRSPPSTSHGLSTNLSHTPRTWTVHGFLCDVAKLSCFPTRPLSGLVVRTPKGLPYFPVPQSLSRIPPCTPQDGLRRTMLLTTISNTGSQTRYAIDSFGPRVAKPELM